MSNLTPLFRQCVSIVEAASKEKGSSSKLSPPPKGSSPAHIEFKINDTFLKECLDFRILLSKLDQFVTEVRSHYLEVHDATSSATSGSLSIEEKNKIDEDFQVEIQQLYEKLKLSQKYEKERQTRAKSNKPKHGGGWVTSIFGSGNDEEDDWELFQTTASAHRTQVLKSLNELTNNINKKFEKLQRKRYERERQLNLLNFQNLGDAYDLDLNIPSSEEPYTLSNINSNIAQASTYLDSDLDKEIDPSFSSSSQQQQQQFLLTQEQEKSLDAENQEFLTLKTNQFQQVEKLRNSMIEIVNLQTELSFQLESQSEQIENLLDNQSQVELDVKMGNKNLNKATSRNKTGSRIIISTSITVALLLLFLDYIS